MKAAVLLIGHGSRIAGANEALRVIAGLIRQHGTCEIVEVAFLERHETNIQQGIDACVAQGAERILLYPYFLFAGAHVVEDLPAYVETYITPDQIERNRAEVAVEMKLQFEGEGLETHVVVGHPANSILDWAERHDVDCIVVSSHRPGLSDYFIGSTAARLVRHAKCSVHVIR